MNDEVKFRICWSQLQGEWYSSNMKIQRKGSFMSFHAGLSEVLWLNYSVQCRDTVSVLCFPGLLPVWPAVLLPLNTEFIVINMFFFFPDGNIEPFLFLLCNLLAKIQLLFQKYFLLKGGPG